jgi:hypothetical protein
MSSKLLREHAQKVNVQQRGLAWTQGVVPKSLTSAASLAVALLVQLVAEGAACAGAGAVTSPHCRAKLLAAPESSMVKSWSPRSSVK